MNNRRYDEIVSLLASIFLGLLIQDATEAVDRIGIYLQLGSHSKGSWIVFIASTLVYYRAIHGLVAYDRWVECHGYSPPFEFTPKHALLNFSFATLVVLVAPYLPFLGLKLLKCHAPHYTWLSAQWLIFLLYLPLIAYLIWNIYWLWRLRGVPPAKPLQGKNDIHYLSYDELLGFTRIWVIMDIIWLSAALFVILCSCAFLGRSFTDTLMDPSFMLRLYPCIAIPIVVIDLLVNRGFYFPTLKSKHQSVAILGDKLALYPDIWGKILPDGQEHCHWGGLDQARAVVEKLNLEPNNRVLDLCCGFGGISRIVLEAKNVSVVGLDINQKAINYCKENHDSSRSCFIEFDVCDIENEAALSKIGLGKQKFDKIVAVDADAWLTTEKLTLLVGVRKLLEKNGIFVFQSYVSSESMPPFTRRKVEAMMRVMGYEHAQTLDRESIRDLWAKAGFKILSIDNLHEVYKSDNLKMLSRLKKLKDDLCALGGSGQYALVKELLLLEEYLFAKDYWSGCRVIAVLDDELTGKNS